MKSIRFLLILTFCILMAFIFKVEGEDLSGTPVRVDAGAAPDDSWYFAVSGVLSQSL